MNAKMVGEPTSGLQRPAYTKLTGRSEFNSSRSWMEGRVAGQCPQAALGGPLAGSKADPSPRSHCGHPPSASLHPEAVWVCRGVRSHN